MSYGSERECFAESAELQRAFGTGRPTGCRGGQRVRGGQPARVPGVAPARRHGRRCRPGGPASYFSNANAAVDLAAPGERIATAVPRVRPRRRRKRLRASRRHELRGADRGRRGAWVAADRPGLTRRPAGAGDPALGDRPGSRRLGPEHGIRAAPGRERASRRAPRNDPLEPNENIFWVNGRSSATPIRVVYDGRPRRNRLRARGSTSSRIPRTSTACASRPRSRTRITVVPSYGDADLAVFGGARATRPSSPGRAVAAERARARVGRDPKPRRRLARASSRSTSTRPRTAWTPVYSLRLPAGSLSGDPPPSPSRTRPPATSRRSARAGRPPCRADQSAVADQGDLLAQRLGFVQIVGGEQDRVPSACRRRM